VSQGPTIDPAALLAEAHAAREQAYAPYSRFRVGAALLCRDGSVVRGCNVENVSYGLSVCAERTAIGNAVVSGQRDFVAIAVATADPSGTPPCGMCRQVLYEFAPELVVIMETQEGSEQISAAELLPKGFGPEDLAPGQE
tara:strand:- start:309 stop:728 length:420 start_codon:yes stop_codon:yes gene_type:complete